jgi:hypothetical protein
MAEKAGDLHFAQLSRVPFAMEEDEATDPVV